MEILTYLYSFNNDKKNISYTNYNTYRFSCQLWRKQTVL